MLSLLKSYLNSLKIIPFFFYWQYRWINNATTGSNGSLNCPLIFEGKGKFITGNNFIIGKSVAFRIGVAGLFKTSDHLRIGKNVEIKISKNSNFIVGKKLHIDDNCKITVNADWEWNDNVCISSNCVISSREQGIFGKLSIGNGSVVGDNTILDVTGNIKIGNEVSIGPNCIIYTHDHIYSNKEVAAWKGGVKTNDVIIKDGAWVASGVTILPGVTIGKRVVVAAGAVVTHDLEDESIYGGVPAKLIKRIS